MMSLFAARKKTYSWINARQSCRRSLRSSLYQGQALTAQLTHIKKQMSQAAAEETDHLAWCEERLTELSSKPSILNPLWYTGSIVFGALAGLAGDKISLGFVAETERQVTAHLQRHLQKTT